MYLLLDRSVLKNASFCDERPRAGTEQGCSQRAPRSPSIQPPPPPGPPRFPAPAPRSSPIHGLPPSPFAEKLKGALGGAHKSDDTGITAATGTGMSESALGIWGGQMFATYSRPLSRPLAYTTVMTVLDPSCPSGYVSSVARWPRIRIFGGALAGFRSARGD